MPVIHRTALLPTPVARVFEVVWDVASYPQFVPWCSEALVHEARGNELVAELRIAAPGMHQRFTTRNIRYPWERIELHLVAGPFRTFEGAWHFKRLGEDQGCKVSLDLHFELSGARGLLGGAFAGFFVRAADQMVDAFCRRATEPAQS